MRRKDLFCGFALFYVMGICASLLQAGYVYPLEVFTRNGSPYDKLDVSFEVNDMTDEYTNKAAFTFYNNSIVESSITEVYFDTQMLLGQYHEFPIAILAVEFRRLPFCMIHGNGRCFCEKSFRVSFLCNWHSSLTFWFNFNHHRLFSSIARQDDPKVWEISVKLPVHGRYIWYVEFFTGPLKHPRCRIAVDHEAPFPR